MTYDTTPDAYAVALLPCPNPWCEDSDQKLTRVSSGHWSVDCQSCGMYGPGGNDTQAEAIAAWNTRPARMDAGDEAVAWLRWKANRVFPMHAKHLRWAADAIERGEHIAALAPEQIAADGSA